MIVMGIIKIRVTARQDTIIKSYGEGSSMMSSKAKQIAANKDTTVFVYLGGIKRGSAGGRR